MKRLVTTLRRILSAHVLIAGCLAGCSLSAQTLAPTLAPGEDWSFPYTPDAAPYSGLFRMGNGKLPSGMVKHIGRTLTWASLNPQEGVFDFSYVDSILAAAKAGNYGVIFRLKASLLSGEAEEGQGAAQSQFVPQWVVDKYANTASPVPSLVLSAKKTSIAPWHPGVQAEFARLIQEWGRRRLLESEHVLGVYLHGISSSSGEEMYVGEGADIAAATASAIASGYAGLPDALTAVWKDRMDMWGNVAGPYSYKVIWVGANAFIGTTYDRAGVNSHALAKGMGARNGFIERYYYGDIHPPVAGQHYDGAHVSSDWTHPLRDGRYWGDENEEDDEYKDPTNIPIEGIPYKSRPLPLGEAHDLAYRSSFFRAAQVGVNFLWTENDPIDWAGNDDGIFTNDALPTWFTLVAGKGPSESPDAACWLREAQVRYLPLPPYTDQNLKPTNPDHPTTPWKNFERLLSQRDVPGAVTRGAAWLLMPTVSLKRDDPNFPERFAEYTARATDVQASTPQRSIAFSLYPAFRDSLGSNPIQIKVTYLDDSAAVWSLRLARGQSTPLTIGTVTQTAGGGWKTATFYVDGGSLPFHAGDATSPLGSGIDFDLHVPNGTSDLTVRYARVVRTTPPALAPTITVAPLSQSILAGMTTTLHVVARGPGPMTYTWKRDGAVVQTGPSPALERTSSDTGTYTVTVQNATGSVTSAPAVLSLDTSLLILDHPVSVSGEEGSSVSLSAVVASTSPVTYQWSRNGLALPGATQATLQISPLGINDAGTYRLHATTSAGTLVSEPATVSIRVSDTPGQVSEISFSTTIDDFDDGNVTSPTAWVFANASGASSTITVGANSALSPTLPTPWHALIDFQSVANYKYAVLRRGVGAFGNTWAAGEVNALRAYLRGDAGNASITANSRLKIQLREGDSGNRWSFDIGNVIQAAPAQWSLLVAPLAQFYGESSNSSGASLTLSGIDQIRIYNNSINGPSLVRMDQLLAVKQLPWLAQPSLIWNAPQPGLAIEPGPLTLEVGLDANGLNPTGVQFLNNGASLGIVTSSPWQQTWNAPVGLHRLQALVTTAEGRSQTTSQRILIVTTDSSTAGVRTVPNSPSGFTAVPNSQGILLSWQDNSAVESAYRLERQAASSGTWDELAVLSANTLQYADTSVAPSTAYTYRLTVRNGSASGGLPRISSATSYSAFGAWAAGYLGDPSAQFAADPDNDGRTNLMEYAVGSHPTLPETPLPLQVEASAAGLQVSFNAARPGVTYKVETSDDLETWSTAFQVTAPGPVAHTVTDSTSPALFVRLSVENPEATASTRIVGRLLHPLQNGTENAFGAHLQRPLPNGFSGRSVGVIGSVSASQITDPNGGWAPGALNQITAPYALRLTSGAAAGRVFSIAPTPAQNTATSLPLSTHGVDLTTLGIISGVDRYELFPYWTLATRFPTGTLHSGNQGTADRLRTLQNGSWISYYHDGSHWRRLNGDLSDAVIMRPDQGWQIHRRGPADTLVSSGVVPSSRISFGVTRGSQTYLTLLPLTRTFAELALDTALPGWQSTPNHPANGDHLKVWGGTAWQTFHTAGGHWRDSAGANVDDQLLATPTRPVLIVRPNGAGTDQLTQELP